jgi:large subunit ribosomal protein L29
MKASEVHDLKTEQLETTLSDKREELMNLRFQQVSGQLTDTSRLRTLRRDIARLMTEISQRKAEGEE